ncbi:ankyrin repeat-containing domain protein [Plectosphaerella cucumerina]|uniref:Ankyrin repeat-containing domain protein n=1 Tax=Plectosphaerella cucumerina TaxID=40658 RepID=A0A8K0X669_9PEZI|nr:ankyrin repeat-containing domain protein [Plectosphaerella cucumerina]
MTKISLLERFPAEIFLKILDFCGILQCRNNDTSFRVIEASALAGMDVLTTPHRVRFNDIVPRSIASTLTARLRLSYTTLSLLCIAVIRGRDSLVSSFVSQPAQESLTNRTIGLSIDSLASPEIVTSLGSLFANKLHWNSVPDPLIVAAASGLSSVVRHILESDENAVNSLDANGRTPLYYAVASPLRTVATVEELLRNGADVAIWFDSHGTPCSLTTYACLNGLFHLMRRLLEYREGDDLQSLLLAVLKAKAKAVRGGTKAQKRLLINELIRRGADPNGLVPVVGASEGSMPLIVELSLTSKLGLETLLKTEGVDVDVKDPSGRTALSWVLSEEHCDPLAADLLLRHGAKLQPYSCSWITRTLRFSTLDRLEWLLLRKRDAVKAFRILHKYCATHTNMDEAMVAFEESVSPESIFLAGLSEDKIRDIEQGRIRFLKPWFRIELSPYSPLRAESRQKLASRLGVFVRVRTFKQWWEPSANVA